MTNVYKAGFKGLLTEQNPADTDMSTILDCQDINISKENIIEARHGLNASGLTLASGAWSAFGFNATNLNVSIFKVDFDSTISGNVRKYVLLACSPGTSIMTELSTASDLHATLTENTTTFASTNTAKPTAFQFDQSFYIVTANGWEEMQKDTINSGAAGVKLPIRSPPFVDINIETYQDTFDLSANWLNNNRKVGIRLTYILNTRYNDETPREIESEPSQIFEVLHPMALRVQNPASGIDNTIVEKSKVRIRIGEGFTETLFSPFENYLTNNNNGRKYSIRVYRTKQVDISEALPTEYYQAFPDIPLGASAFTTVEPAGISTVNDTVDFGAAASAWQNGTLIKYRTSGTVIAGLTNDAMYYLGSKSGTTFQLFPTPLLGTTGFMNFTTTGSGSQFFLRAYEANLTVNDDGIVSLPQLYTNPNQDGEVNANSIPPIAKHVTEYKNYHVAANIREPLRAYINLVKQPLAKNVVAKKNIGIGIPNGNHFFTTFETSNGASDFHGLSSGDFGIDSPFFRRYPPSTVTFSGSTVTSSVASDLPVFVAIGPTTGSSDIFFDANFVQKNATMSFKFDGGTTITASVEPQYDRTSPYTRYTSLPGAWPYSGSIPYDKNLEWLQFAGPISRAGFGTMPFYSIGTTTGETEVNVSLPTITTVYSNNTRGNKRATIIGGGGTYTLAGTNVTITNASYDISELPEPGIICFNNHIYFAYKTVSSTTVNTLVFQNVSSIDNNLSASSGATFVYGYALPATTIENTNLYFKESPIVSADRILWDNGVGSALRLKVFPAPLTGYYDKPIGIANSPVSTTKFALTNPLFLGNLSRSPAQLLDLCISKLVSDLNKQAAIAGVTAKFIKTDTVGQFYVEYYGGTTVEARIFGDNHAYEPEIIRSSTEWTTLAEYTKNNIRALSISRYNLPESFSNSTILAPFLVGKDTKEIMALAKNSNYCYILKEDGIWRMTISGNSSVPRVDEVVNIDTTTFCQASYSVQEINEEIIFLSQNGFMSITGNDIQNISRNIETDVKTSLQKAIANAKSGQIRSWVNEEKRIYGCTIRESTSSWVTYVFNTYTREWTKWLIPVLDARTDETGKTFYAIGLTVHLLSGVGTLQQQLDGLSTVGNYINYYLAEEVHTTGLYRNEADQWDFKYLPASIALGTGNQVVFTDNTATTVSPWSKLGGSNVTYSGLSFFVDRPAYYKKAGIYYPCTFVSNTLTTCTVEFPAGVPASITTIGSDDGLYAGVPASFTLNPTNLGTPDTNKVFTEFHLHTVESIRNLSMQFSTDSRSDYSLPRVFTTTATNRTVYRTFIPTEMMRGRWLIRKVSHSTPGERFQAASQTLSVRDTASLRSQKSPR